MSSILITLLDSEYPLEQIQEVWDHCQRNAAEAAETILMHHRGDEIVQKRMAVMAENAFDMLSDDKTSH